MKIFIDARGLKPHPTGVGRYARELVGPLARCGRRHDFVVLRHEEGGDPIADEPNVTEIALRGDPGSPAHFLFGASALHKAFREHGPPELFHDLFHTTPMGTELFGVMGAPLVVTLHDLIWLDYARASSQNAIAARWKRAWGGRAIRSTVARAQAIICPSEATARALERLEPKGEVRVIPHGAPQAFVEAARGPAPSPPDYPSPYIVAVGNAKAYKNLGRLAEALARVRKKIGRGHLVLVGPHGPLTSLAGAHLKRAHFRATGHLDEPALIAALWHAHGFVFPSLVEGYGLPIVEAMALGTPCAVSDLDPMREVARGAALRFDPLEVSDIARVVERLLVRADVRRSLAEAGRARAQELSWEAVARATLEVYEDALERHPYRAARRA